MHISSKDDGEGFYPVTDLCKATRKYIIHTILEDLRYIDSSVWYVHHTELPHLAKRAKDTGNHSVIDYSELPKQLRDSIDSLLKGRKPVPKTYDNHSDYYSTLHLLPTAPAFILEATWRAVIKTSHPDVGGDAESFLRMKAAYENIKSSRG